MTAALRSEILATVPRLRAFAFSLTGSSDRADDLVQETLVRALTHIAQFQPGLAVHDPAQPVQFRISPAPMDHRGCRRHLHRFLENRAAAEQLA
jgi:hypothetical protein